MFQLPDFTKPGEEPFWSGYAEAVDNAAGIAVGAVSGPLGGEDFQRYAVHWDLATREVYELDDGGRGTVDPNDVNDHGEIVGYNGAYWSSVDAEPIFLPMRRGDRTASPQVINNHGVILGQVTRADNHLYHVIWLSPLAPRYWEPVLLLPSNHRWTRLDEVADLNDANQMVGFGRRPGDSQIEERGFILSPVFPSFDLSTPSPGDAGTSNTFTITDLSPGDEVELLYGLNGGGALIPGCNLQANALQIDNPITAGSAIADGTGTATIQGFVPNAARNKTIVFQALVKDRCAISGLVVHGFQ